MSGEMWLVFIVTCAVFGAWELIKKHNGSTESANREQGFPGARPGKPPHPHATLIDLPGMRLIDLRSLPVEDLRLAKFGVVQEQLLLERPMTAQIWIAPVDIVRGWSQMGETAMVIMNGRFRDSRCLHAKNFIYPYGGKLTKEETAKFELSGLEIVESFTNLSNPPKNIEDFLEPSTEWKSSPDDRPLPGHEIISTDPYDGRLIHIIETFAFIDLRRIHPPSWENGAGLDRLEKAFRILTAVNTLTHVVWIGAPWVCERIDVAAVYRIEKLVGNLSPKIEQRLAIVSPTNEPVGSYELTRRLGHRLRPLAERLAWRTKDRGAFDVHPIDALHDAYFASAWKQPRL